MSAAFKTPRRHGVGLAAALLAAGNARAAVRIESLTPDLCQWQRCQFRLSGLGRDGVNPFDPDRIAVDATVAAPDGRVVRVPLFWYVGYNRSLNVNARGQEEEKLTPDPTAPGEWRLRWTPQTPGRHTIAVEVRRGNVIEAGPVLACDVAPKSPAARGFVSVEPVARRYFRTADGRPLPLIGMNACWPGKRGTYDYDDWLPAMAAAGMNYTRLWQATHAFRAELTADDRLNYSQPSLWQLDTVFDRAAAEGINIMLCLGFHGEFQTARDSWGSTGYWAAHGYNRRNGGPCDRPNDFFTDPTAADLYRKRLRYLVARYGANTNLLSWQFFNEVNNIYGSSVATRQANRDRDRLHPPDVVAWHERMGWYLRAIDANAHAITTSFGSAGEQPAMWALPQLDYANWHWYANWGGPYYGVTEMTAAVGTTMPARYGKPVVIAEFGTDGRGWSPAGDPDRRGLRQAIWGGVFAGTAGTAMPWWWESIHRENLYPLWRSLRDFLPPDFGGPQWHAAEAARPSVPVEPLGTPAENAARFDQRIDFSTRWGKGDGRPVIVNRPGDDGDGRLAGYIFGHAKADMQSPTTILLNAAEGARLTLHVNSVAAEAALVVRQNGEAIFRRTLADRDGKSERNGEYDEDVAIDLKPGRAEVQIDNDGPDWVFLDSATVHNALAVAGPPTPSGGVPLERYVLTDGHTRLLWLVDARYAWPRARGPDVPTLAGATVTLDGVADGAWDVEWWHPRDGKTVQRGSARSTGGRLPLQVPPFAGEVAARITPRR